MSNFSYPNRDWIQQQYGNRMAEIFDALTQAINTLGTKTGAEPVGPTDPPPSVSALNVAKLGNGSIQAAIQDHTPIKWGIHYFLEYSDTPGFERPHVIHLGQSRTWTGPDISAHYPYWRTYSMYPGQEQPSAKVHHQGAITAAPPMASTGSGTASGSGRQGGLGFGIVPRRTPPQRNPGPPK